jgi:hypothetical protein
MRFTISMALAAFTSLIAVAQPVYAQSQSLGDVARKEEERRKEVKQPAKVITNKDLGSVPLPPPLPAAASTPQPGRDGKAQDAEKDKGPEKNDKNDKGDTKDQAYWSSKKKALLAQLDRDQTYAEALQTRINSLSTEVITRDDPAQRATLSRDRAKAMAELDRLQKAIQADKKAISDLDEEARRAGVPPGWLR